MKQWIWIAVAFAATIFVIKVVQMDGEGAAIALVQGVSVVILLLIIAAIVAAYKFIRSKVRKET